MTGEPAKDLATEAVLAAVHGDKDDLLHLQHALIQEEVKERKKVERQNLAGIKADEGEVTNAILKTLPENELNAFDSPEKRKERYLLEQEKLQLHREERTEERAYWTDVQPLTKEDRDIHKAMLGHDQRKKRLDELM
jgi:hypothetical protein